MLIQKSNVRHKVVPSIYLFVGLAVLLLLAALALFISNQSGSQPATSGESGYKTYRNQTQGYSISLPADWQTVEQNEQGVLSASAPFTKPDDNQGGTNFSRKKLLDGTTATVAPTFSKVDVVAYNLESALTAREFLLAKSNFAPDAKITSLTVGGKDAVRVEVQTAKTMNYTEEMIYTSVYITSGNRGYIIAGYGSTALFNHIIGSFQTF